MDANSTQKRATAGGEFGANGEWYRGGTFIATTDAPKSAPAERGQSADALVREAQLRASAARINAWLDERRAVLADAIAQLTANPGIEPTRWAWMLENGHAGFVPGLGRQLSASGSLSPRQADYAVKALLGRRTKKNADKWDAMHRLMTEQYRDEVV